MSTTLLVVQCADLATRVLAGSLIRAARPCGALGLCLAMACAANVQAQQPALVIPSESQQTAQQNQSGARAQFASSNRDGTVQQVQLTLDPRRPLDSRIEAMPRADEKIEVIHHRSQLIVTKNPIRRIAWSDTQVLDVVQFSPQEISLIGQAIGSTDLWLWFEGQEQPLMYVVTVVRDPSLDEQRALNYGRIERKLSLLYPNSKVYLIPVSRKIIVRGQARDAEEAANIMQIVRGEVIAQEGSLYGNDLGGLGVGAFGGGAGGFTPGGFAGGIGAWNGAGFGDGMSWMIVDELRVPGEFQIMINVRTAEIQRSQLRRWGVDWNAIINNGNVVLGQTLTGGAATLTGVFDSGNLTIAIDALASNGVAKILDDARVVTLSGQAAAFLSGGEYAVPTVVGIGGAQGQQTSFRGYGTSIIVTPTLLDSDLIRLQIVPELSELNGSSVGGIPGVNVRRVQTRVELREGQSIALGGVFSRRENTEITRIPFLGDIPVVGSFLFSAKRATEDEQELLIIVTPEIIRPMDADQVPPLPGWYSTHPNDCDFYKYNRIEGNPDLGNYQLLPYGNGQGYGQDVGYNFFNPSPADGQIAPSATGGAQGPYVNGVYANGMPNSAPGVAPGQPQYADPNMIAPGTDPNMAPQYGVPQYNGQPGMAPQQPMYAPGMQGGYPTGPMNNIPQAPGIQPTPAASNQQGRNPSQVRQASGTTVTPPGQRAPQRR
ncbi:type II and III secretion system protein family protein [Planctomicrobium piriforme]|uniref:Pilus assembly protein CpaC n=1 Tax=Planctomicrobium piriforme TaxID=1576369 RepID=A0A1I3D411_9PLAN|nr:pilus assembly protein N-terminal domain-containing protein [Planctomicrobium piriforme]SFH81231.1 pilus assembly protein CpaC [Planctomicrobium piriforme]